MQGTGVVALVVTANASHNRHIAFNFVRQYKLTANYGAYRGVLPLTRKLKSPVT